MAALVLIYIPARAACGPGRTRPASDGHLALHLKMQSNAMVPSFALRRGETIDDVARAREHARVLRIASPGIHTVLRLIAQSEAADCDSPRFNTRSMFVILLIKLFNLTFRERFILDKFINQFMFFY